MKKLLMFIIVIVVFAGCGSTEPTPEAAIAEIRVKLKILPLEIQSSDYQIEEAKYLEIAEEAEDLEAFKMSALAYSMLAYYYEKLGDRSTGEKQKLHFKSALDFYQRALIFDKKEQEQARTPASPFPNSAAIAISLNNISVLYEKLEQTEQAIIYGNRALKINQMLGMYNRILADCKRLIVLNRSVGDDNMILELQEIVKDTELSLSKQSIEMEAKKYYADKAN